MRTILQIPMDKQLRNNAEKVAHEQGFSSLQEIVRVFLSQLASSKIEVTLQESTALSPSNEKRYVDMTNDFESGKKINTADNIDCLISQLNED